MCKVQQMSLKPPRGYSGTKEAQQQNKNMFVSAPNILEAAGSGCFQCADPPDTLKTQAETNTHRGLGKHTLM